MRSRKNVAAAGVRCNARLGVLPLSLTPRMVSQWLRSVVFACLEAGTPAHCIKVSVELDCLCGVEREPFFFAKSDLRFDAVIDLRHGEHPASVVIGEFFGTGGEGLRLLLQFLSQLIQAVPLPILRKLG